MSAGLAASTVTPGSTAPPSSRTTPAMVPLDASCAREIAGTERRSITARTPAGRGIPSSLRVVTNHGDREVTEPNLLNSVFFAPPWFVILETRVFVYMGAESSDIATRMQRAGVDTRVGLR